MGVRGWVVAAVAVTLVGSLGSAGADGVPETIRTR